MRISKRSGAAVRFNSSSIAKAIMKAMNQTAEEIEVKRSALCELIYEVVETQIEERLKKSMENARDKIRAQIHVLRDSLRKLRAFYNQLIYGNDSNFSKVLNFLKRIWSRTKTILEVIFFIEGIYNTIVIVQNMISNKNTSLLNES